MKQHETLLKYNVKLKFTKNYYVTTFIKLEGIDKYLDTLTLLSLNNEEILWLLYFIFHQLFPWQTPVASQRTRFSMAV